MIYVKGSDGKAKVVSSHLTDGELYYDKGKQDEYDRFWDSFQDNGNRTDYYYGFNGAGWNIETLKPKYVVKPSGSNYAGQNLFRLVNCNATQDKVIDYRTIKDKFDLSEVKEFTSGFYSARINYIDIDLPNCTSLYSAFNCAWNPSGRTHLTLKVSEKCTNYQYAFDYNNELKELIFVEGSAIVATIGFPQSEVLSKTSITSIINALSVAATSKTCTLTAKAVNKAFETSSGANNGSTSTEWLNLVATKSNWTISLV